MPENNSEESSTPESMNSLFARWKNYANMSNLGPIARRYFVMNAFDGVLTALGLIIGTFILFLRDPSGATQADIVIPGLATTLAIGISGIMGAFLAETAERKKASLELKRAMVEPDPDCADPVHLNECDYYPEVGFKETDDNANNFPKFCVDPEPSEIKIDSGMIYNFENMKEEKSLSEKAESFASYVLSLTDGLSPALGSLCGLLPFFFGDPTMGIFITSLVLEVIFLFGLGAYLAKISEDSIFKYGLEMVLAGVVTVAISMLLGGGH